MGRLPSAVGFAQSPSEIKSWTAYPGGAPANTATALVKLGTPAAFVGGVGKDTQGEKLEKLLHNLGVDITGVQLIPQYPTRQVYVLRSETGERTFAGFGGYSPHEFADAYLEANFLPIGLWESADFLVIGTLELAYSQSRKAVFRALELADKYHLKVLVDVNWRSLFWVDPHESKPLIQKLWPYVDFIKLTQEEAQWLFNTTKAGDISRWLDSVEGIIITNGEGDVNYFLNDYEGKVTPPKVKVVDTTGAGDAFVAGLIHQLCQQGIKCLNHPQNIADIINYACVVGALTTTKTGAIAAQPTAQEVAAFLGN